MQASNNTPLYVQVKEALREEIRTGVRKPGERLPSEEELRERFAVSRATVRQALADLELEGYVVRQQGRGTFVHQPKIEMKVRAHEVYSFTRDMQEQGLHPVSHIVQFEVVLRRAGIAALLDLGENEPLIKLVRLRMANNEPIMLETTYLPEELVPGLTEAEVRAQPLYNLLETRYNLQPVRAVDSFEPVLIDDFAARMLAVPVGSPALYVERVGSLANGRKVELSQAIVRGDRCRYFVELLRHVETG